MIRLLAVVTCIAALMIYDHPNGRLFPPQTYCKIGAGTVYNLAPELQPISWIKKEDGTIITVAYEVPAGPPICVHGSLWDAIKESIVPPAKAMEFQGTFSGNVDLIKAWNFVIGGTQDFGGTVTTDGCNIKYCPYGMLPGECWTFHLENIALNSVWPTYEGQTLMIGWDPVPGKQFVTKPSIDNSLNAQRDRSKAFGLFNMLMAAGGKVPANNQSLLNRKLQAMNYIYTTHCKAVGAPY